MDQSVSAKPRLVRRLGSAEIAGDAMETVAEVGGVDAAANVLGAGVAGAAVVAGAAAVAGAAIDACWSMAAAIWDMSCDGPEELEELQPAVAIMRRQSAIESFIVRPR